MAIKLMSICRVQRYQSSQLHRGKKEQNGQITPTAAGWELIATPAQGEDLVDNMQEGACCLARGRIMLLFKKCLFKKWLSLWSPVLPLQLEFNLAGAHISLVESPWLVVGLKSPGGSWLHFQNTPSLHIYTSNTVQEAAGCCVFVLFD